ncbi:MAG: glycosyltransferase [Alphaproteobacteria bacterium]|nr:MAG: glycosyltransferase [Alphaproteobacteria bacterium]
MSLGLTSSKTPRPTTVLLAMKNLREGALTRALLDVVSAIRKAGGRAIVASPGGGLVHELRHVGAIHATVPLDSEHPVTVSLNTGRLVDIIRASRVDIVHAFNRSPAWSAMKAARRTRTRLVTTVRALHPIHSAFERAYCMVMTEGDVITTPSHWLRDSLINEYGLDATRVMVVPHGVSMDSYDPERVGHTRPAQLAESWMLPEECAVILLPGSLDRSRGHAVLLRAMARLKRRDMVAVFPGADQGDDDAYRDEIRFLIARFGLEGRVLMPPETPYRAAALWLASVVVSPAIEPEGFNPAIIEAQAMGRPVVLSHHGASAELVRAGETAWLVPPNNSAALAAALQETLALSASERLALAERTRAFVSHTYSRERMCASLLTVYDALLQNQARAPLPLRAA